MQPLLYFNTEKYPKIYSTSVMNANIDILPYTCYLLYLWAIWGRKQPLVPWPQWKAYHLAIKPHSVLTDSGQCSD